MFAYPRVAERLFGRAHAIDPMALRAIMEGPLLRRVMSGELQHDESAAIKSRDNRRTRLAAQIDGETVAVDDGCEYALTRDGIAIVPVFGVLAQRFDFMAALCGWATYEGIIAVCDAMANDYRVKGILFDIESPGGEVSGMLDAADAIIELGQLKPVWSVANSYAYSAAYALAGSAERLIIPRMADVGSIGAVAVHIDESAADVADGLSFTAIYSGARKIDGWGHAPLNDAARAVLQDRVDYARQEFAALVGRQGRISAEQAMATEAAIYTDQAAIDAGLADDVANFDQALTQLTAIADGRSQDISIGAQVPSTRTKETRTMATPKTAAQIAAEQTEADRVAAAAKAESDRILAEAEAKAKEKAESDRLAAEAEAKAKEKAAADAAALAAAKANEFTIEMAAEITSLCALAGASASRASELIAAKTPIEKARATLLKEKADRDAASELNPTAASNSPTAGWDEVTAKVNAEFGVTK